MSRSMPRALLGALLISVTAVSIAAAPQYAVIDLGSTSVAGSGLVWQNKQPHLAPATWPSSGGSQCSGGVSINQIFVQYGNVAVGFTCEVDIGEQAAKWTVASDGTVSLTDLGRLPGAQTDVTGPYSAAYDFNNVGDIVGQSQSNSGTNHPGCPCVAYHGFLYNNGTWTDLVPIAGPEYGSIAEAVNDSHEVVGVTNTVSSANGDVLNRAFVYIGGTMYNLSFYLVGGPTVLLTDATWIDCQGNIAAVGNPASNSGTLHSYLLVRQGPARTNCAQ